MMVAEDVGMVLGAACGSAWAPSLLGDSAELQHPPRFNSPSKTPPANNAHFLVPIQRNSAAARRASHCSGLTSIDGRLANLAVDAHAIRGTSFRRRAPTDTENVETTVLRHLFQRSTVDRAVQFTQDHSDDDGHAYLRGDCSSISDSDSDYPSPARRHRKGTYSVSAPLQLPALPSPSLPASAASGAGASATATGGFNPHAGAVATAGPTGVTLAFLESLLAASRPGATLQDVFRTLVLPATRTSRCAYVHLLGAGGEYRARATHVLVCSWDERVSDLVELLSDFVAMLAPPASPPLSSLGSVLSEGFLYGNSGGGGGGGQPVVPEAVGRTLRRRSAVYSSAELGEGVGGPGEGMAQPPLGTGGGPSASAPPFAVWLDLLAINFHAAAAPPSPITAAATSAAAAGVSGGLGPRMAPLRQPNAPSSEVATQERARALPAAIASTRAVLLLPGAQGAALREPSCMLAVWHALRGRGCAGGTLTVLAPADLDVGLVQAAFEGLAVSSKPPDEQHGSGAAGASSGGGGGWSGAAADGNAASRMSPDRIAMRAMREGATVHAASVNAAIYAADPLPSRTVREGVTAAAVSAGTTLLARPVTNPTGHGPIMHAVSTSALPPTPPMAPVHTVLQNRSCSVNALEAPAPPQPVAHLLPSPLTTSRLALLSSPLRHGGGGGGGNGNGPASPSGRPPLALGDSWVAPSVASPSGSTTNGGGSGAGVAAVAMHGESSFRLLGAPSGRSMSFTDIQLSRTTAGGEDDVRGPSSIGPISSNGIHRSSAATGAAASANQYGGGDAGWPPPGMVAASDYGAAMDPQAAARRIRSLAPLLDVSGPPAAEGPMGSGGAGGGSSSPGRLQQLRRKAQAPWEAPSPLYTPTGLTAAGPHGSSLLSGAASPLSTASGPNSGGNGGGGVWGPAGPDAVMMPLAAAAPPASGGIATPQDKTHTSLPLPKVCLAQLHLAPLVSGASASVASSASQLNLDGRTSALAAAAAAALADEDSCEGMPSPFSQRRRGQLHGLPPRFASNRGVEDDGIEEVNLDVVDATVSITTFESDAEQDDPPIMLDAAATAATAAATSASSSFSLLAQTRSVPAEHSRPHLPLSLMLPNAAASASATAAATAAATARASAARLHPAPPLSPPPPIPHSGGGAGAAGAADLRSNPDSPPLNTAGSYRSLSPDLARLVGAAKLLTAFGQPCLGLRLARHAYTAARAMHGFNNLDTARCAVVLASLAHHCNLLAAPAPMAPPPLKSGGLWIGGSVAAAAAASSGSCGGSGACTPRCLSPARSRLALTSNMLTVDGGVGGPQSGAGPVSGGCGAGSPMGHGYGHNPVRPAASPPPAHGRFANAAAASGGAAGHGGPSGAGAGGLPTLAGMAVAGTAAAAGTAAGSSTTVGASVASYCEDPEGFLRGAAVVLERFLGAEHEEVVSVRQGLAAVLAATGRHDDAIALLQRMVPSRSSALRWALSEAHLASAVDLAAAMAAVGRQRDARKLLKAQLVKLEEDDDDAAAAAAASVLAAARGRLGSAAGLASGPAAAAAAASTTGPAGGGSGMGMGVGVGTGYPAAASSPLPPSHHSGLSPHPPTPTQQQHAHQQPSLQPPLQLQLQLQHLQPARSGQLLLAMGGTDSPLRAGSAAGSSPNSVCASPGTSSPAQGAHGTQGAQGTRPLTSLKRAELLGKCAHQLAQLKASAGKTEAARVLYRRTIEAYSTAYGSRHAVTAGAMLGLAALSHNARDYGEALELYRTVLEVYVELYGPHHAATTRVSNRLGAVEEALEDEMEMERPV